MRGEIPRPRYLGSLVIQMLQSCVLVKLLGFICEMFQFVFRLRCSSGVREGALALLSLHPPSLPFASFVSVSQGLTLLFEKDLCRAPISVKKI